MKSLTEWLTFWFQVIPMSRNLSKDNSQQSLANRLLISRWRLNKLGSKHLQFIWNKKIPKLTQWMLWTSSKATLPQWKSLMFMSRLKTSFLTFLRNNWATGPTLYPVKPSLKAFTTSKRPLAKTDKWQVWSNWQEAGITVVVTAGDNSKKGVIREGHETFKIRINQQAENCSFQGYRLSWLKKILNRCWTIRKFCTIH